MYGSILLGLSFWRSLSYFCHWLIPSICWWFGFDSELFSFPILIIIQMSLIGKRILVTGGNGYLGNYFAVRCFKKGASVMALSRYSLAYWDQDRSISTLKTIESNGSKGTSSNPKVCWKRSIVLISSFILSELYSILQLRRKHFLELLEHMSRWIEKPSKHSLTL